MTTPKKKKKNKPVEVKIQFVNYYLYTPMDIINYFHPSEGDKLDGRALSSKMPRALQASILSTAREKKYLEQREYVKKKRQALPVKIKKDVSHFDWKY